MQVVVASFNPVKIRAVQDAYGACFPDATIEVESVAVSSGVSEQPLSDLETRRGAHQRVSAAREALPEADFWVGQEGGLERHDGQWLASAWMVVADRAGTRGEARTPTLPLPPAVQSMIDQGVELGDANDRVFATLNSKQGGGAFGLLTDGRLTRGGVYTQALMLALIPFTNTLWKADRR